MASYVFLIPPGGPEGDERVVVVRDGFAFFAFLLPPLWFLVHRLRFEALLALLLLVLAGFLADAPALAGLGPALGLAVCLFSGLEGRNLVVRHCERRGYRPVAALAARNLAEAEEIFFSKAPLRTRTPENPAGPDPAAAAFRPAGGDHRPVLGLFDLHGGR